MEDAFSGAMYTGLTEEEKDRIRKQQLMAMGAAMLAGRGNFANNLGQGMLVGINQGESATTQLRRDKLAEMEMQYRQGQMNAQRQAAAAALAKEQAAIEQAKRAAELRGNISNVLNASSPTGVMGSLAPTLGNAETLNNLAQNPEDLLRAKYERAVQMAALGGDKDVSASMLALMKELNPTYGLDPKIGVEGGKPYAYVVSNQGKSRRLKETPPDKISFVDQGDRKTAVSEYAIAPGTAYKINVSPDTSARIADSQAGRAQTERHWQDALVPAVDAEGNPISVPRKMVPKEGVKMAPKSTADRSSGDYGRAFDDATKQYNIDYPVSFGMRDPKAPPFDQYLSQFLQKNASSYGMAKTEPPNAEPPKPAKKVVRTGTRNGKRVVQYEDGTIEELQ